MNRSVLVALREVKTFLRDRGDLAFSLLLPIIVFALIYGAFGGSDSFHGTAYIVNEDQNGPYSQMLLDILNENSAITVTEFSAGEAADKLAKSDILMAVYIPAGFSPALAAGNQTQLVFHQRGNGGQEGQIVASIIRGAVNRITQDLAVHAQVQTALAGLVPADLIRITVQKFLDSENRSPVVIVTEKSVGPDADPVKQFLPGIVTMFVLFSITLNARAIVEERKKGTLERLLTTQLSVGQLFTGKFLSGIFRGFVQSVILMLLAYAVFQLFTPVSFLEVLLITLVFSAAASAVGLLIAVIVRTEDAATWFAVTVTMLMTMLGGTFFAITPGTVWETLSKISINTYANQAVTKVIEGGNLVDGSMQLIILVAVTAVAFVFARLFFKVVPGGK